MVKILPLTLPIYKNVEGKGYNMNIEYEKEGNKLMKQEDAPSAEANKFYS